jgi:hypothetical protein
MRVIMDNAETELNNHGLCPACGCNWDGGNVYEVLRSHEAYADKSDEQVREISGNYGAPDQRFSKLIGIEVRGVYDGVCKYRCPECTTEWQRAGVPIVDISRRK